MKRTFTLIFSLPVFSCFAQTFTINPNDTLNITANFNQLGVHDIYQDNNTFDTIQLKWDAVLVNLPSGWDYSMCDLGHCYTGIPGGTMDPLPYAQTAFLGLNINPMSISGIGTVRVYVYDEDYPSQGDTLTWIVRTPDMIGVEENEAMPSVTIYPNPANDRINLTIPEYNGTLRLEITDISGRNIESQLINPNTTVNISGYTAGMYILRVITENGKIITRSFIKE